ncbi:rhodanese-like domain-containing protein [Pseudobacteriovorax antillogorgiicola]|uniref:Rhodanese-related sulfurtransferase n=1 Tax=Pseudobacteriovorax antillogorgiicola TaxID=1513793 RepID=A0A1Y6BKD9_9BACT|nr:rhodanese-like domain-containing protein [Pseudobacteriovorax antillogorgiicola]TCS54708.1 rhodanese-related sulfurtransferase [Pseudobacteriovorax antillogorgiicola]SMF16231.1 Rhodanese-related sulfurtransferase [Pseudobacteriovorax antillogorgiicola]
MPMKECEVSYFQELQEKSGVLILIDVRESDEFGEVSAPCAKNYPLSTLDVQKVLSDLGLNSESDQSLYFICRSGRRSASAAQKFIDAGFENTYNLLGGMMKWQELGLPTRSTPHEQIS